MVQKVCANIQISVYPGPGSVTPFSTEACELSSVISGLVSLFSHVPVILAAAIVDVAWSVSSAVLNHQKLCN